MRRRRRGTWVTCSPYNWTVETRQSKHLFCVEPPPKALDLGYEVTIPPDDGNLLRGGGEGGRDGGEYYVGIVGRYIHSIRVEEVLAHTDRYTRGTRHSFFSITRVTHRVTPN